MGGEKFVVGHASKTHKSGQCLRGINVVMGFEAVPYCHLIRKSCCEEVRRAHDCQLMKKEENEKLHSFFC